MPRKERSVLVESSSGRAKPLVDETAGLVEPPLPTPMLQPWEVFDQDLFDLRSEERRVGKECRL